MLPCPMPFYLSFRVNKAFFLPQVKKKIFLLYFLCLFFFLITHESSSTFKRMLELKQNAIEFSGRSPHRHGEQRFGVDEAKGISL